jgi:WhiB family transcriptional regulator, redox-sensing transcriptional regulator
MEGRPGAVPQGLGMPWDWRAAAACRLADTSLFFGPERELVGARRLREQQAKAICATCPVLEPCRAHALVHREPYGVWGGLTERERAAIWAAVDSRQASAGDPA